MLTSGFNITMINEKLCISFAQNVIVVGLEFIYICIVILSESLSASEPKAEVTVKVLMGEYVVPLLGSRLARLLGDWREFVGL